MSTMYYFKNKIMPNITIENTGILPDDLIREVTNKVKYYQLPLAIKHMGSNVILKQTDYYETMDGLENFYKHYKDKVVIVNEYEEEIEWVDFLKLCEPNPFLRTHLGCSWCYEDNRGYEFERKY